MITCSRGLLYTLNTPILTLSNHLISIFTTNGAWGIEEGVRSQNSGKKKLKLSSCQLMTTGYWLLNFLIGDCGLVSAKREAHSA
jgi:hypothetical protein